MDYYQNAPIYLSIFVYTIVCLTGCNSLKIIERIFMKSDVEELY